jgi:hypothetical protein
MVTLLLSNHSSYVTGTGFDVMTWPDASFAYICIKTTAQNIMELLLWIIKLVKLPLTPCLFTRLLETQAHLLPAEYFTYNPKHLFLNKGKEDQ